MSMIHHALEAADRGWHVFPCEPAGKKPLVMWADEATADVDETSELWRVRADANVGVSCGPSGLAVLDIDDYEALPDDLYAALPDTYTVSTGKGEHRYYLAPDGPLRNSAKKIPGCDVRADGGYVIAAGSLHPSGATYEVMLDTDLAPWPDDLLASYVAPPAPAPAPGPVLAGDTGPWGRRILEAETARILSTVEGSRNQTLFEAALKVMSAVAGGHIGRSEALTSLSNAAVAGGLPRNEADRTIEQADDIAVPRHPDEQPDRPATPAASLVTSTRPADDEDDGGLFTLSISQLGDLPEARWVVPHRVPVGFSMLFGPSGAGKTFAAVDWCLSAAVNGRRVLYMLGEGASMFPARIHAWQHLHGVVVSDDQFKLAPTLPRMTNPASLAKVEKTLARWQPDLMVIDTWSRALGGVSDKDTAEQSSVIEWIDVMRERYGTSTLAIAHPNKSTFGGNRPTLRGSYVPFEAADAVWLLDDNQGLDLVCEKMKDAVAPRPMPVHLRSIRDSLVMEPTLMHLDWED